MPLRHWAILGLCLLGAGVRAQDLEPRRWSHIPTGSDYLGAGYLYTTADIFFDPVIKLEDVSATLHSIPAKYLHAFPLFGRTARAEVGGAWQEGTWEGLLDGTPRRTSRHGFADPVARVAVNLYGTPAVAGKEFAAYRRAITNETIVGAALAVQFPLGQYDADRLINLGQNRYSVRPQLGAVHAWGRWSLELNGSVWFFTDNDDFYINQTRTQAPLYSTDTHLLYMPKPGWWAGASGGYAYGGESRVGGTAKDDRQEVLAWALAAGLPLHPRVGVKVLYVTTRTQTDLGSDTDSVGAALLCRW